MTATGTTYIRCGKACSAIDILYLDQNQRFVWDQEKASSNLGKHKVDFEKACEVFLDPFLQIADASAGDEQREAIVGSAYDWSVLGVVHLARNEDFIRIISAHFATKSEKGSYYENRE